MIFPVLFSILFAGHYFIYASLVSFYNISVPTEKLYLEIGLIILGASFIISSILAHYFENIFVKVYYLISGLWLAIGWNTIMALALVWIVIFFGSLFAYDLNIKLITSIILLSVILYSGYGIWCAFHPVVSHITFTIENLPESWKNKTVVQLSDLHLGHIYGEKFLHMVIKTVNEINPDVVFITGDLFDGMDSNNLAHLVQPFNDICAPDGTYFITGNHETYLGVDKAHAALKSTTIKTLNDQLINIENMQIIGMSYPMRNQKKDVVNTMRGLQNFDRNKPHIVLYHSPLNADVVKEANIHLQLAGHTHNGQIFPFQYITHAIYGGQHKGFWQENDFAIYTSRGIGSWGPAMRTTGRPEIVV